MIDVLFYWGSNLLISLNLKWSAICKPQNMEVSYIYMLVYIFLDQIDLIEEAYTHDTDTPLNNLCTMPSKYLSVGKLITWYGYGGV